MLRFQLYHKEMLLAGKAATIRIFENSPSGS